MAATAHGTHHPTPLRGPCVTRHTGHGPREPVEWEPDLLGDPWRRTSVALPPIRGERVIATLVASTTTLASTPASCDAHPSTQSTAVLYLHGFNDYFFHTHLATEVEQMGLGFSRSTCTDMGAPRRQKRPAMIVIHCASTAMTSRGQRR